MIQVIQVVQVVRMISIDDMHSENIRFSWSKSSNYQEKLRCHARDGGRTDGKWKIVQCSELNQKPQYKQDVTSKHTPLPEGNETSNIIVVY